MPDLGSLVWTDPERMGGVPCFVGTRVPVHSLFDYLAGGESLDEFLDSFPTVERSQAEGLLQFVSDYVDALAAHRARERTALPASGGDARG